MNTSKQMKALKENPQDHSEELDLILEDIRDDFEKKNFKLDTAGLLFTHLLDDPAGLSTDIYQLIIKVISGAETGNDSDLLLSRAERTQIDRVALLAKFLSDLK